jgi:hypothetical protein
VSGKSSLLPVTDDREMVCLAVCDYGEIMQLAYVFNGDIAAALR